MSEKRSSFSGNMFSEHGPPHPVYELSEEKLSLLRMKAISVGNFAVLCMRDMFTIEERTAPNTCISGKRGKLKLDYTGKRLEKIHKYVLNAFNVKDNALKSTIKQCNTCMDQANRNIRPSTHLDRQLI